MAHLEMLHGGSMSTVKISNPSAFNRTHTRNGGRDGDPAPRILSWNPVLCARVFLLSLCSFDARGGPPRHTLSQRTTAVVGQSVPDSQSFSCFAATPRAHSSTVSQSSSAGDSDDRQNSSTIMTFKREQSG